jgi:hypothetical protein
MLAACSALIEDNRALDAFVTSTSLSFVLPLIFGNPKDGEATSNY